MLGLVDFFTGILGGAASASGSQEMAQFQSTFSDVACTAKALQCQVRIMELQAF